jgi:hypothetical protein
MTFAVFNRYHHKTFKKIETWKTKKNITIYGMRNIRHSLSHNHTQCSADIIRYY